MRDVHRGGTSVSLGFRDAVGRHEASMGEEFADVVQADQVIGHAIIQVDVTRTNVKLASLALYGLPRGNPASPPKVAPCECRADGLARASLVSRRGDPWRLRVIVCLQHRRLQFVSMALPSA